VLRGIEVESDGRLLVGPNTHDDAGVVVLGEAEGLPAGHALHLVQTVDFFPPVVDDPRFYGAIAAANSVSDVYAMGGKPVSALNLSSFPKDFDPDWMVEILRSGQRKLREANVVLAGGHTVEGAVQFGYAVTGVVSREDLVTNAGARPGDLAYLTKPLGMGAFTTSAKRGKISWETMQPAAEQMAVLNAPAAEAMRAARASACTDVTGYGLVGHARNVANASGVTLRIRSSDVPLFGEALSLARNGWLSGGAKRGRAGLAQEVSIGAGIEDALVNLLFDAETSGGLLILIDPARAPVLERELALRHLPVACIGACIERASRQTAGHAIELV
jgi:selenide,water dikinase